MATPRTLKQGHVYVMKDGSVRPLWNETGISSLTGFLDNSSDAVLLGVKSGDIVRKTGGDLLAVTGPNSNGTVVVNETSNTINGVGVVQNGSNTHMWYGYDPGGAAAYSIHYRVSTDSGATWGSSSEVITETPATWNSDGLWPIGVWHDTTNSKYWIYCMGYNGTIYQIGRYEIGTASDLTNSGNYTADGDNPIFPASGGMSQYAAYAYDPNELRHHIWAQNSSTVTEIWHASAWDGETFTPDTIDGPAILEGGIASTSDDAYVRPSGAFVKSNGWFYLFYEGGDGSNANPMCAAGPSADSLFKVGSINNLASGTYSEVYYCLGDLTYSDNMIGRHVMDRGGPGAVIDTMQQSFSGSFSFYAQGIGTSGVAASGESDAVNLWAHMRLTNPSVNEPFATDDVAQCHLVYRIDDDSGSAESFFLFPRCVLRHTYAEGAEGNVVTTDFECTGDRRPYWGNYS